MPAGFIMRKGNMKACLAAEGEGSGVKFATHVALISFIANMAYTHVIEVLSTDLSTTGVSYASNPNTSPGRRIGTNR